MEAAPIVSLARVSKSFGRVQALVDVDLDLRPGEVHVLLGENGAGKSTLAAILAGVKHPDAGKISISGQARHLASPRDALMLGISTVFQHGQLVPSLSLVDNTALGGVWWRRPQRAQLAEQMRTVAQSIDPAAPFDPYARADALSLGERQHAEIVRALMRGSRVLVLDEPTATLTPAGAADLGRLMRRLVQGDAGAPVAVVFITHKLDEALDFGDRITILRHGRVVARISPRQTGWDRETAHRELVNLMFAGSVSKSAHVAKPHVSHGNEVLQVKGLSVDDVRVPLADINLTVHAGEIVGIAGIDGNGQKQLAETLAGQRAHSTGEITLNGKPVGHLSVGERTRHGLRYASDDRLREGTVGALSIALNLLLKRIGDAPFWRRGVVRQAAIDVRARKAIADFDIRAPDGATPVGHLSGGNVQKVVLARELASGAQAVIFAKPTQGLDIQSTIACHQRIRQAAEAGLAVLLISTDLDEILALSDRIVVMDTGRVIAALDNGAEARALVGRAISQADGQAA
ncbi:ABC transporter ATP-binding protein [Pseudochelatococcus sp. G4_1912]|uniref:ABC transporter ATP-binding protein n=1 Tax=Pseudochelatococcus sp. G4_1912 TaxID=3114288 RepID=UPI0039C72CEE